MRRSTIPTDPLDSLVPLTEGRPEPATGRPGPPPPPRLATHKLTTYLTDDQYMWALDVSHAARRKGRPLTISDVIRAALGHLKSATADPGEAAAQLDITGGDRHGSHRAG